MSDARADAIAVVVVAHSSGAPLIDATRRALAARNVAELVVVDNASDDGSIEQLGFACGADARLRVVRNVDNPGFARACNQGAAATGSPWIAFLNPDCLVDPDTFDGLVAAARSLESPGVIGADVRDADGRPEAAARRRDPTPLRALARVLGRREAIESVPTPITGDPPVRRVDAVSGALMLVPRDAFVALGGFDEGYRLHAEDLDLCRRARDAGRIVAVAESVRVTHLKGTSSARRPLFVEFHKHRGMWRYFRKFDAAAIAWPLRVAVWCGIWLRFLLKAPVLALRQVVPRR